MRSIIRKIVRKIVSLPGTLTILLIVILAVFRGIDIPVLSTREPSVPTSNQSTPKASITSSTQTTMPSMTNTPTTNPTPTDRPTPTNTPTPTVIPTPSITPTPTPRPPSVEILADELTVHQGPGQHFPILYTVRKGDILIVQSRNISFDENPWFLIRIRSDEAEEWITGDIRYVRRYNFASLSYRSSGGCPGAPPQRVQVGGRARVCTQSDLLRVRRQPSLTSSVVTRLRPGTYVTVLDGPTCANNYSWWKIQTGSRTVGWVSEGGDRIDPYFICPAQ